LKQIGTSVATYFSDGIAECYPAVEASLSGPVWIDTLKLDTNIVTCPVKGTVGYIRGDVLGGAKYSGSADTLS
jgi:hypothetical protein